MDARGAPSGALARQGNNDGFEVPERPLAAGRRCQLEASDIATYVLDSILT
jgi:hypothetical protein